MKNCESKLKESMMTKQEADYIMTVIRQLLVLYQHHATDAESEIKKLIENCVAGRLKINNINQPIKTVNSKLSYQPPLNPSKGGY